MPFPQQLKTKIIILVRGIEVLSLCSDTHFFFAWFGSNEIGVWGDIKNSFKAN